MTLGLRAPTHGRPTISVRIDTNARASQLSARSTSSANVPACADRERGSALVMAIIIMLLLSMIGIAIVSSSQRERDANRTRSDRMTGQGPVDIALAQYRFGLQSGKIAAPSWVPSQASLNLILSKFGGGATGQVIPNSQLGVHKVVHSSVTAPFTVELGEPDEAVHRFWQLYRVEVPNRANGTQLKVLIRAWAAKDARTTSVTDARIVEATFRQGRFSDYQLITNGPIQFEDGVTVRGPIHTNGQLDGSPVVDRLPSANDRVFSLAGANVTCAAGADVTVAFGTVSLPSPSCQRFNTVVGDENYISFQGLAKTFRDMSNACGGAVNCTYFNRNGGPYVVELRDGSTYVTDTKTNVRNGPIANPVDGGFLFDNSVIIRGRATGRLSIAAFAGSRTDISAPTITIVNNTYTDADGNGLARVRGEALGLFAQGDVVINPTPTHPLDTGAACTTLVHAVMVSERGSLTLGRQNMGRIAPSTQPIPCGAILVSGTIASSSSPVLSFGWPSKSWTLGFSARNYTWDPAFRDNPPPFTPGTDLWDMTTYTDADQSLL